ncbi:hypothetical protein HDU81_009336 [Chytriomyces hyalinus]|nr:hypothetical protein HDU81_009336 [Chytriomyces hyalinus]
MGLEREMLPQKRPRKKLRKRLVRSPAVDLAPAYVWPVDMHQQPFKYNSMIETQNKVMAHLMHVLSKARLSGISLATSAAEPRLSCDIVAGLLDRGNSLSKIIVTVVYSFSEIDLTDFRTIHEKNTGVVITSPKFGHLVLFEPRAHFAKWLPRDFNCSTFSNWLLLNARKLAHLNKKERRSNIKYPLLAIHLGVWGKPQSAVNLGLPANTSPKQIYPAFTKESLVKGAHLREPRFNKIALDIMENDQFLDFVKAVDNLIDAIAPMYDICILPCLSTVSLMFLSALVIISEGVKGRFLIKKCKELYDIESPIGSSIFMTIAINCSPISKMQAHMDFSDEYSSLAVVICLASVPFSGGDLVFWQLKTRFHFDTMDVLVFRSRLFAHGNTDFHVEGLSGKQFKNATEAELKSERIGGRGSIVFFSGSGILHAIRKKCSPADLAFIDGLFRDSVDSFEYDKIPNWVRHLDK